MRISPENHHKHGLSNASDGINFSLDKAATKAQRVLPPPPPGRRLVRVGLKTMVAYEADSLLASEPDNSRPGHPW